jgi:hypothetical protein
MTVHETFYTETMARILADQKKFQHAADIYRHLLAKEPENTQWARALETMLQAHTRQQAAQNEAPLAELFQRWIDISSRYNKVKTVKKLKP